MTSFVKMWVTSSVAQQKRARFTKRWGGTSGCCFSGGCRHTNLLAVAPQLDLTHVPRTESPLGEGEPEKTARAGARGSEGKQADLGKKTNSIHTAQIPMCP